MATLTAADAEDRVTHLHVAALNMPDLPRDEHGQPIPKDAKFTGRRHYFMYSVSKDGARNRHPCTAAVYQMLMDKRPDRNKKVDYQLSFRKGTVISVSQKERQNTLMGFAVDDPEARFKPGILALQVFEDGTVTVIQVPDRISAATVDELCQEAGELFKKNGLRAGAALQDLYVIREIRQLPGHSEVQIDVTQRM